MEGPVREAVYIKEDADDPDAEAQTDMQEGREEE
jgi:hypothetical protein